MISDISDTHTAQEQQMYFPEWVNEDDGRSSLRSRRLRYLLGLAALEATNSTSFSAMALSAGYDPSVLSSSIARGCCSKPVAVAVELACKGRVKREWLMNPELVIDDAHDL